MPQQQKSTISQNLADAAFGDGVTLVSKIYLHNQTCDF